MNLRMTPELIASDGLWLTEFDELCSHGPGENTAGFLSPFDATNALIGWVADPRTYSPRHHRNKWQFAINDFCQAFDAIGPNVLAALGTDLVGAKNAAAALLPTNTNDSPDATNRTDTHTRLRHLVSLLGTQTVMTAAWRDLQAICQIEEARPSQLNFAALIFWSSCELFGHEMDRFGIGGQLSGILSDGAFDIAQAQADLGDRDYPSFDEFDISKDKAGLTLDQRLALCERLLSVVEPESDNIVWLSLDRAGIDGLILEYGSLVFYESEWLYGNLFQDGPSKHKLPPELIDANNHLSEYDIPHGQNILSVRVDLGRRSRAKAVSDARKLVEAAIILATPNSKDWKILGNYMHFTDGSARATGHSRRADDSDMPYSSHYDPTEQELTSLKDTPVSPANINLLAHILEARKWIRDATGAEPLVQVITYVRALERVASMVDGGSNTWHKFTTTYAKMGWMFNQIYSEINDIGFKSLHSNGRLEQSKKDEVDRLRKEVIEHRPKGYRFHLDKAMLAIPKLATVYADEQDSRAIRCLAVRLADAPSIIAELDRLSHTFDTKLNRLISCRDASQHGGPISDASLVSVTEFAHKLAALVTWTAIRALLESKDVSTVLSDANNRVAARYANLTTTGDPMALLPDT